MIYIADTAEIYDISNTGAILHTTLAILYLRIYKNAFAVLLVDFWQYLLFYLGIYFTIFCLTKYLHWFFIYSVFYPNYIKMRLILTRDLDFNFTYIFSSRFLDI